MVADAQVTEAVRSGGRAVGVGPGGGELLGQALGDVGFTGVTAIEASDGGGHRQRGRAA